MATRQKLIHLHNKASGSTLAPSLIEKGEIAVKNATEAKDSELYVVDFAGSNLATFETKASRKAVTDEITEAAGALADRVTLAETAIGNITGGTSAVTSFGGQKGAITLDKEEKTVGDGEVKFTMVDNMLTGSVKLGSMAAEDATNYVTTTKFKTDATDKISTLETWKTGTVDPLIQDIEAETGSTKVVNSFGTKTGKITLDAPSLSAGDGQVKFVMSGNKLTGSVKLGSAAAHNHEEYELKDAKEARLEAVETKADNNADAIGSNGEKKSGLYLLVNNNTNAIAAEEKRAKGVEDTLSDKIGIASSGETAATGLHKKIEDETGRAKLAESGLSGQISTLETFKTNVLTNKNQVVNSIADKKGDITLRGGLNENGSVNLTMTEGKQIQASIVGLGTAAYESKDDYVTKTVYDNKMSALDDKDKELSDALGTKGTASDTTAFGLIDKNAKAISSIKTSIQGGTHFKGVLTALPKTISYKNGDIIAISGGKTENEGKEFICNGDAGEWVELGDTTAEQSRISANEEAIGKLQTADTEFSKKLGTGFTSTSTVATQIDEAKTAAKKATSVVSGSTNITVTPNPGSGRGETGVTYTVSANGLATTNDLDGVSNKVTALEAVTRGYSGERAIEKAITKATTNVTAGTGISVTPEQRNSTGATTYKISVNTGVIATDDKVNGIDERLQTAETNISTNSTKITTLEGNRLTSVKITGLKHDSDTTTASEIVSTGATVGSLNLANIIIDCGTYD